MGDEDACKAYLVAHRRRNGVACPRYESPVLRWLKAGISNPNNHFAILAKGGSTGLQLRLSALPVGQLLFHLVSDLYERTCIIVTTNLAANGALSATPK